MSYDEVLLAVREQIDGVRMKSGLPRREIVPDASLIDDLGLDSLMFIDLSLAIEQRFTMSEFPLQAWADAEAVREEAPYTVESLAAYVHGVLGGD